MGRCGREGGDGGDGCEGVTGDGVRTWRRRSLDLQEICCRKRRGWRVAAHPLLPVRVRKTFTVVSLETRIQTKSGALCLWHRQTTSGVST